MSAVARPDWWSYPLECAAGHPWGPGRVTVGWMPCDCPNARANRVLGHLWVRCRAEGCSSIWYRPRHERSRLDLACRPWLLRSDGRGWRSRRPPTSACFWQPPLASQRRWQRERTGHSVRAVAVAEPARDRRPSSDAWLRVVLLRCREPLPLAGRGDKVRCLWRRGGGQVEDGGLDRLRQRKGTRARCRPRPSWLPARRGPAATAVDEQAIDRIWYVVERGANHGQVAERFPLLLGVEARLEGDAPVASVPVRVERAVGQRRFNELGLVGPLPLESRELSVQDLDRPPLSHNHCDATSERRAAEGLGA